jgi:hypothetical protein
MVPQCTLEVRCSCTNSLYFDLHQIPRHPQYGGQLVAWCGERVGVHCIHIYASDGLISSAMRSPKSFKMMFILIRKLFTSFRPCSMYQSIASWAMTLNRRPLCFIFAGSFTPRRASVFRTLYNLIASPRRPTFSRRSRPSM